MSNAEIVVGIVSAVLLLVGTWYVAKSSRRATDGSTAVSGMAALLTEYRSDRVVMKTEREELRNRIAEVEARLTGVEGQLRDSTRTLHVALAYIERLLDFVAEAIPDRKRTPPAIPSELTDHLPPSLVDDWRTPPPQTEQES